MKKARHRKTNITCSHSYVGVKKVDFFWRQSRMTVNRAGKYVCMGGKGLIKHNHTVRRNLVFNSTVR